MSKQKLLGGVAFKLILVLPLCVTLTACNPQMGGQANNQQQQQALAQNNPYAQNPNAPAPYNQQPYSPNSGPNLPQTSPWPGTDGGMNPTMPQMPANMPNMPAANSGQPLQLSQPPAGMKPLPSQAGHVFRAYLSGQAPVPQQSRDAYNKLMAYFDNQPQVLGYLDEPSGRMSQVGFQGTKNGVPVMGMLVVTQGQNGVVATVMLDSPATFQQSMQTMMSVAQQP